MEFHHMLQQITERVISYCPKFHFNKLPEIFSSNTQSFIMADIKLLFDWGARTLKCWGLEIWFEIMKYNTMEKHLIFMTCATEDLCGKPWSSEEIFNNTVLMVFLAFYLVYCQLVCVCVKWRCILIFSLLQTIIQAKSTIYFSQHAVNVTKCRYKCLCFGMKYNVSNMFSGIKILKCFTQSNYVNNLTICNIKDTLSNYDFCTTDKVVQLSSSVYIE